MRQPQSSSKVREYSKLAKVAERWNLPNLMIEQKEHKISNSKKVRPVARIRNLLILSRKRERNHIVFVWCYILSLPHVERISSVLCALRKRVYELLWKRERKSEATYMTSSKEFFRSFSVGHFLFEHYSFRRSIDWIPDRIDALNNLLYI